MSVADEQRAPAFVEVDLDKDVFMRSLIRDLAGVLQEVVGLEDAAGFVSLVGSRMGSRIDAGYRRALGMERFDRETLANVLVDLKRRIDGDFYVEAIEDDRIVLGNNRCPFGDKVKDRPALCMMTSNVFGKIAAEHMGYARVSLEETIAAGAPGCRVVVSFGPGTEHGTDEREYFRAPEGALGEELGD